MELEYRVFVESKDMQSYIHTHTKPTPPREGWRESAHVHVRVWGAWHLHRVSSLSTSKSGVEVCVAVIVVVIVGVSAVVGIQSCVVVSAAVL